MKFIQRWL